MEGDRMTESLSADDWDRRYSGAELVWAAAPNRFVAEALDGVEPGRALDLAAGEGRNAVWLAERGWEVTAVDFSVCGCREGAGARRRTRRARHVGGRGPVVASCAGLLRCGRPRLPARDTGPARPRAIRCSGGAGPRRPPRRRRPSPRQPRQRHGGTARPGGAAHTERDRRSAARPSHRACGAGRAGGATSTGPRTALDALVVARRP